MKIVFMGTPDFSLNILQALIDSTHEVVGVVTQPDKLVGRKQVKTAPPIKQLANKYQIPVFQPEKIKNDYDQVLLWESDIIITCAYGQIIPKILLETPTYKAINVHASLLPKYRGGAPIHQAIIDGCKTSGISIMYMSELMDEGDIISQKALEIDHKDNVLDLHQKLSLLGADLLLETLPSIFNNTNNRLIQDHTQATYAYNIKPSNELINWNKNGEDIYNQIRGLDPWPGAYTNINGKRVKIYKSEEVTYIHNNNPGEIIHIYKDGILVASGNSTCIKVLEAQLEGKKRQLLKDVFNGKHPFTVGLKFE